MLALVQLAFSGWHIVGSLALQGGADPLAFAAYREVFASMIMVVIVWANKQSVLQIQREDYLRFFCLGICSFINVVGTIIALTYISATRYAIFQPSIPCVATAIAIIIGIEAFSWIKGLGILLAVGGAVLIDAWDTGSSSGSSVVESNVTVGSLLVSVQVVAMASLIVFQRPLLTKYESVVVTFGYYTIGTLITLVMCACWEFRFDAQSFVFGGALLPWLALAYATVFATVFTYNTYTYVSKILSPSVITIYNTLQPVGTVVLSVLFLGSGVGLSEGVGGALVALGLIVTVVGRRREIIQMEVISLLSNLVDKSDGNNAATGGVNTSNRGFGRPLHLRYPAVRVPSNDSQPPATTIIPFNSPYYDLNQQQISDDGEYEEPCTNSGDADAAMTKPLLG